MNLKKTSLKALGLLLGLYSLFALGYWLHKYVWNTGLAGEIDFMLGPQYLGILPFQLTWETIGGMLIANLIMFGFFLGAIRLLESFPEGKEVAK